MCGRFANGAETDELVEEFAARVGDLGDWSPRFSIVPTDTVPIVRERRGAGGEAARLLDAASWDFRPAFVDGPSRPRINARIETIATNGLWRDAFIRARCLVPMTGYFEWTGSAGAKQPHLIHGGGSILAAAGLGTARRVGERWLLSVAVVTREARDAAGEVHERMPAFLEPDAADAWLAREPLTTEAEREGMLALLAASSSAVAATLTSHEVDPRLNSVRAVDPGDPTLIAPRAG